jgi:hypothetical protein
LRVALAAPFSVVQLKIQFSGRRDKFIIRRIIYCFINIKRENYPNYKKKSIYRELSFRVTLLGGISICGKD